MSVSDRGGGTADSADGTARASRGLIPDQKTYLPPPMEKLRFQPKRNRLCGSGIGSRQKHGISEGDT
jgi:hypothetical protein